MREVIRERMGEVEECHYLPDRLARMRYRLIDHCSAETCQRMLERGWRRFGRLFFRHACAACQECRSLRVEVEGFRPSRAHRRIERRNQDLQIVVQPPTLTHEHLDLYDRYHADMSRRKGWPERFSEPFDYYLTFVQGHRDFGFEILYRAGDRLLCVALVDVLPWAVSAIYAFYDPSERRRSLGVFSILRQIELARHHGVPYCYLGYWIAENPSMSYKAGYRPHQILKGRPDFNEHGEWRSGAPPD
jgi:arginine-tRNA-protein transferase